MALLALDRLQFLNYRGKIMVTGFLRTYAPLRAIVVRLLLTSPDSSTTVWVLPVGLVATLAGTAVTLHVLNELLKPIRATAAAAANPEDDARARGFHVHSTSAANDLFGRWRIEADLRVAIERERF